MTLLSFTITSLMASFGNQTSTSFRTSNNFPTKSQIIGLLCNAIGHDYYSDDEKEIYYPMELSNSLQIIIIPKKEPSKFVDFQTARIVGITNGSLGIQQNIAHKEYFIDCEYDILIEGEYKLLRDLKYFLNHPRRLLFFGRRNCSIDINNIKVIDCDISNEINNHICLNHINKKDKIERAYLYTDISIGNSVVSALKNKNNNENIMSLKGCLDGGVPISFSQRLYAPWFYYKVVISKSKYNLDL